MRSFAALAAIARVSAQGAGDGWGEYSYDGFTPESTQWEVVDKSAVSGPHLTGPSVWSPGTTDSFEECQSLCAQNTSCVACDWAGDGDPACLGKKICNFRSDDHWQPRDTSLCTHRSARKIDGRAQAAPAPRTPTLNPPLGYQPNIIFILTDDQDSKLGRGGYTDLGSLEVMPKLQKHLMAGGARMSNAFVNTPICCPSRTEFLSGRYYHNVGPPAHSGSCMHVDTSSVAKRDTGLFGMMVTAGYEVGVFGKVTNDQQNVLETMTSQGSMTFASAPISYNDYDGLPYYNYNGQGKAETETLNGTSPKYGTVYQSAQIGNRTLDWLDALRADPVRAKKPFFAYVGPHAPHYPATPAPWYAHTFDHVTIPITPNYNVSSPDKTQHVRQNPPLSDLAKCWEDQHFRDRWASLLSVDDIVDALMTKLEAQGLLETTFLIYASDHGYKQGQWRIGTSKQHPYETDIRIPMLARGPGIEKGATFGQVAVNLDITPTIIDLAGFPRPPFIDGRSMVPWLISKEALTAERAAAADNAEPWRDQLLIEYKSVGTYYNDHSAIWSDSDSPAASCGGLRPRGPAGRVHHNCVESSGVGDGECYFVDSTHSNSWRALRILNHQDNLQYIEYDPDFTFNATDATGAGLQFYELYDISKDPYQMTNIYNQTSAAKRTELHASLAKYFACGGDSVKESNCRDADRTSPSRILVI